MNIQSRFYAFLTAALLILPIGVQAAPNFDTGNLALHVKELVKREGRNKLMKYAGDYMTLANSVMTLTDSLQQMMLPLSTSTPSWPEWSPVVPKSIAELLKAEDPDVNKVQAEVKNIILMDRSTPETLKKTELQQRTMLLRVISYSYGAAERSIDLSALAAEETNALEEEVNKTDNGIDLIRRMMQLQTFSTRKVTEILHLQSRLLEVDSMLGLINKIKNVDTIDDQSDSGQSKTQ